MTELLAHADFGAAMTDLIAQVRAKYGDAALADGSIAYGYDPVLVGHGELPGGTIYAYETSNPRDVDALLFAYHEAPVRGYLRHRRDEFDTRAFDPNEMSSTPEPLAATRRTDAVRIIANESLEEAIEELAAKVVARFGAAAAAAGSLSYGCKAVPHDGHKHSGKAIYAHPKAGVHDVDDIVLAYYETPIAAFERHARAALNKHYDQSA